MKRLIENYINGNLSDAKKQAENHSWGAIYSALRVWHNKSEKAATAIADYLKGRGTFQAACDAEAQEPFDAPPAPKVKATPISLDTILAGLPPKVVDVLERAKCHDASKALEYLWFAFQLMPSTSRTMNEHELTPENMNLLVLELLQNFCPLPQLLLDWDLLRKACKA